MWTSLEYHHMLDEDFIFVGGPQKEITIVWVNCGCNLVQNKSSWPEFCPRFRSFDKWMVKKNSVNFFGSPLALKWCSADVFWYCRQGSTSHKRGHNQLKLDSCKPCTMWKKPLFFFLTATNGVAKLMFLVVSVCLFIGLVPVQSHVLGPHSSCKGHQSCPTLEQVPLHIFKLV